MGDPNHRYAAGHDLSAVAAIAGERTRPRTAMQLYELRLVLALRSPSLSYLSDSSMSVSASLMYRRQDQDKGGQPQQAEQNKPA